MELAEPEEKVAPEGVEVEADPHLQEVMGTDLIMESVDIARV